MPIQTYADLHRGGMALAYRCERLSDVDLAEIVADSGDTLPYVGRRPNCRECGEIGTIQVQPHHALAQLANSRDADRC